MSHLRLRSSNVASRSVRPDVRSLPFRKKRLPRLVGRRGMFSQRVRHRTGRSGHPGISAGGEGAAANRNTGRRRRRNHRARIDDPGRRKARRQWPVGSAQALAVD
jgi:hypothetical protein